MGTTGTMYARTFTAAATAAPRSMRMKVNHLFHRACAAALLPMAAAVRGRTLAADQHTLAAALAILLLTGSAPAQTMRYRSGAGTWDTTSTNWGTSSGGPYNVATWTNGASATFEGTVGTVTLGGPVSVSNLTFTSAGSGYTIAGQTLNFALGGTITQATKNQQHTITSAITGGPAVRVITGTTYDGLTFAPTSGTVSLGLCTVAYFETGVSGDKAGIVLGGTTTGNSVYEVTYGASYRYGALTKLGTGTWTVGNVNIGIVYINAGSLVANGEISTRYQTVYVNNGGTLHYNNPGAVCSVVGNLALTSGGSLDNSSGAAITTSLYDPPQSWGNWTFVGSNGAASDLNIGVGSVTLSGSPTVTVQNASATFTAGGVIGAPAFTTFTNAVAPGTWRRLTVAFDATTENGGAEAFRVLLDGKALVSADAYGDGWKTRVFGTPCTPDGGTWFLSAARYPGSTATNLASLSTLAFKGGGGLFDDLVATLDRPNTSVGTLLMLAWCEPWKGVERSSLVH